MRAASFAAALFASRAGAQTTKATTITKDTRACQGAFASLPYCDHTKPIDDRVNDFIARLWASPDAASIIPPQLTARHGGGGSPAGTDGIPALGLPEYDWGLNCIHGVQSSCVSDANGVHCPTSFMNPVNFGSTWNATLGFALGAVIATETRALWLAGAVEESTWSGRPHIGLDLWSPNININRGRNVETPSEDPYMNGVWGAAQSLGVQTGEDSTLLKTVVTLKHWDAYSLEDSDGFERHNFNAVVSPYALETTYFPAFRKSVVEGGAKGVMCSYNAVNGVPTCASDFLTSVLRGKWGFDGYISSDTGAIEDIYKEHKYVVTEAEAACVALVNGTTDVCSGAPYHNALMQCPHDAINAALFRTFKLRFQLGLFDPPTSPYWNTPLSVVDTDASRALNLLATRESMVLLKNDAFLPLPRGKTIAVIGPHALAQESMVGNYLGQLCPSNAFDCIQTPFAAISAKNVGGKTLSAVTGLTKNVSHEWTDAIATAKQADIIVLALGIDGSIEGESNDRTSIDLPALQHALVAALSGLNKPMAIFLLHGGSLDTTPELSDANVRAIVDAFYPGMVGAAAISDTLFGDNPSLGGKMPYTSYPASYVDEIKMSEMELDVGPGRGYRFYTGKPIYSFGYGLSLTTFTLALASGPSTGALVTEKVPSKTLTYVVTVTNTGNVAGDEVVQAYFAPQTTPSQPKSKLIKQLFGYTRVHLEKGASQQVTFTVDSASLRMVDRDTGATVSTPGSFDIVFTNGVDQTLHNAVTVSGAEVLVATFPA